MPVISMFYGIIIRMYNFDDRKHHKAHIHAQYQGYNAVFAIDEGVIIAGDFLPAKSKLVMAWIEIHREELLADWQLAINGERLFKIKPLD